MPPAWPYHGTATRFAAAIEAEGLQPQARQYGHLSADQATAQAVGQRHGRAVLLRVDAQAIQAAGFQFYLSANGVWLTREVPSRFLQTLGKH